MQTADKRTKIRRTLRYPATVDIGGDADQRPCTLCDASQDGAQILVDDPASLPNQFTLILGYDGTARRRCRVVWRSDTQIGVEFTAMPMTLKRSHADSDVLAARSSSGGNSRTGAGSDTNDSFDIDSLPSR